MKLFEYPFIIITILAACILVMGLIGLYLTIKSIRCANGTEEKNFCGIGKIESVFEKGKNRSLIYISVSLENVLRIYSEAKVARILERIRRILLAHFCLDINGDICLYGKNNFLAINALGAEEIPLLIDKCYEEITEVFTNHEALNVVYISFGYYCTSATDVPFKTALGRAKQACSMAEDKKTLHFRWDSSNGKEFERKIKIENNIENEIENNRFFLEYQPIVDAKTDKFVGAEVLSRLNSPSDGILTPQAFLSAVNNVGLNKKFDYYIFEKNCKWIASDKARREKYFYTINFSRYTLCDATFAEKIIKIVENYALDYSCIAIEILEDKYLTSDERRIMTENLIALKENGVLILLDDFGKGSTSFTDLAGFDISIVKIDKSITHGATDKTGALILKNIIRTAHDLGFKTLCEGIETEEHKRLVAEAGCDMIQGYYINRPMPVARLETLFEER